MLKCPYMFYHQRITFFLIFFFLLLVTPDTAHATQGACSSHGGVNCSIGADVDGSVICNDGWTNSAVSFSSMVECNQAKRSCTQPVPVGCSKEIDYLRLNASLKSHIISTPSISDTDQLHNCRTQIDDFRSITKLYNACLEAENRLSHLTPLIKSDEPDIMCWQSFGIHSKGLQASTDCTCEPDYTFNTANDTCIYDLRDRPSDIQSAIMAGFGSLAGPVSMDTAGKCPSFSSFSASENICKCNSGFIGVLGTCVIAPVYCHTKYGQNSEWNNYSKSCECSSGYQIDTTTNQCASVAEACSSKFGDQATTVSGVCSCKQGAEIDPLTGKCESILVILRRNIPSPSGTPSTNTPNRDLPAASENIPVAQAAPTLPRSTDSRNGTLFYIGTPKTKQDLSNCFIVGKLSNHLYYLRGNRYIKQMTPVGKKCFESEDKALRERFRKAK